MRDSENCEVQKTALKTLIKANVPFWEITRMVNYHEIALKALIKGKVPLAGWIPWLRMFIVENEKGGRGPGQRPSKRDMSVWGPSQRPSKRNIKAAEQKGHPTPDILKC